MSMKYVIFVFIPSMALAEIFSRHLVNAQGGMRSQGSYRERFVQTLATIGPQGAEHQNHIESGSRHSRLSLGYLFPVGLLNRAFKELLSNLIEDQDILRVVSKLCTGSILFTLGLSVAGSFGVDTKPIVGLSSAVLITIGLGTKDLLTNIFAGLFVVFGRPFRRGSNITIHGTNGQIEFEGLVKAVDGRYLHLQKSPPPTIAGSGKVQSGGTTLIPLSYVVGKCITVNTL